MRTLIAEELESEELHRFHADFRWALLMHRKAALNLFFHLQFPMAESPLYEGVRFVEHLVFVRWLAEPPSEKIREYTVYVVMDARRPPNEAGVCEKNSTNTVVTSIRERVL